MEIPVKVPQVDTQRKIVKLAELFKREQQLTNQLMERKEVLINALLF